MFNSKKRNEHILCLDRTIKIPKIDFGKVCLNSIAKKVILIKNPFVVSLPIRLSGPLFEAENYIQINSNQNIKINLHWSPKKIGKQQMIIKIEVLAIYISHFFIHCSVECINSTKIKNNFLIKKELFEQPNLASFNQSPLKNINWTNFLEEHLSQSEFTGHLKVTSTVKFDFKRYKKNNVNKRNIKKKFEIIDPKLILNRTRNLCVDFKDRKYHIPGFTEQRRLNF